ncbi:MAG: hypothetical protein LBD68_01295 [Zoogloeaceae bacterium]|nr:hypothetical protein [Zoogloeaceae bacterium]
MQQNVANAAGKLKDVLEIADTVATFVPGVGLAAKAAIKGAKEGCGLLEKCLDDKNSGLAPAQQDQFIQRQMDTTDFKVAFNNFSPEFQERVAGMSPNAQDYKQGCAPYANLPEDAQGQSVKNIGQQLSGFVKSIKPILEIADTAAPLVPGVGVAAKAAIHAVKEGVDMADKALDATGHENAPGIPTQGQFAPAQ